MVFSALDRLHWGLLFHRNDATIRLCKGRSHVTESLWKGIGAAWAGILLGELFVKVDEYYRQVHGIEKKDYSELMEGLMTPK
jgi:hypothetical protein